MRFQTQKKIRQSAGRLVISVIVAAALLILFGTAVTEMTSGGSASRNIVVGFYTYNGYGNNLYLDNIRTGNQINYDVKVTSLLNFPYDTTYSVYQSGTDTVTPLVGISNVGFFPTSDSVKVYLRIDPIGYLDSARIAPMSSGQSIAAALGKVTYPIGTPLYIKTYCGYEPDSNRVNDTLWQYSIVLPGYTRGVLYEEFTSNSSPACANNNSFLNAFVNNNFDSVNAIKYHIGILGTDSFYLANPVDADARRRYYYAGAVPLTFADGKTIVSLPYGDSANLYRPYFNRLSKGTPVRLTVTDERIGASTIRSKAVINTISATGPGNYRLRFNAVERYRMDSLQGSNSETDFYDIFRDVFPDTNGIPLNLTSGISEYTVEYDIAPGWRDSMIYTVAYIQNDNNREIINSGKSRSEVAARHYDPVKVQSEKADTFPPEGFPSRSVQFIQSDSIQSNLSAELFEAFFPPIGWRIFNQDGFITFEQFTGANGPSIGGLRSATMRFYDYNIPGQSDSMYSAAFTSLYPSDTLRFDYAYAQYNSTNIDSLIVKISVDGGLTFPYEVFRRGGLGLATAPLTSSYFVPQNNTEWRVFSASLSGIVSVSENSLTVPHAYGLQQNYPNPFNPSTTIKFSLPVRSSVKISLYDLAGKEVMRLADDNFSEGEHYLSINGSSLASGAYFCVMQSDGYIGSIKMLLLK